MRTPKGIGSGSYQIEIGQDLQDNVDGLSDLIEGYRTLAKRQVKTIVIYTASN